MTTPAQSPQPTAHSSRPAPDSPLDRHERLRPILDNFAGAALIRMEVVGPEDWPSLDGVRAFSGERRLMRELNRLIEHQECGAMHNWEAFARRLLLEAVLCPNDDERRDKLVELGSIIALWIDRIDRRKKGGGQ